VMVGQSAMSHPEAAVLRELARFVANASGAALNLLPHGANTTGAWRAGAVPVGGLNAAAMLEEGLDAYLLWGIEPEFDIENPARALKALKAAGKVIAVAEFASGEILDVADILLPLAPVAETVGSYYNLDGSEIPIASAGRLSGEARPGWKILRRLGAALELDDFEQVSLEGLQAEIKGAVSDSTMDNGEVRFEKSESASGFHRIGDVPLYSVDSLCRRATPLQNTAQADNYWVGLNPKDASGLDIKDGDTVKVSQASAGTAEFPVTLNKKVPVGGVWLKSGTCGTRELGASFGPVGVEKA